MDDGAFGSSRSCDVEFEDSRAANRDSGNNALTRWLRVFGGAPFLVPFRFFAAWDTAQGFRSTALFQPKECIIVPPSLQSAGARVVRRDRRPHCLMAQGFGRCDVRPDFDCGSSCHWNSSLSRWAMAQGTA